MEGLCWSHFGRRLPLRPLDLARHPPKSGYVRARLADADPVAQCHLVGLDQVEEVLRLIDDDRADRMRRPVKDRLTTKEKGHVSVGRAAVDAGREIAVGRCHARPAVRGRCRLFSAVSFLPLAPLVFGDLLFRRGRRRRRFFCDHFIRGRRRGVVVMRRQNA